jgi:hypothetical protein
MKSVLGMALAVALPAAAMAQADCTAGGLVARGMPRWSAAVMEPPVLGPTELGQSAQPARSNLVLARQSFTVARKVRYLAAPVMLPEAGGRTLRGALGRGAPITVWRDSDGVKYCAIGWANGPLGAITGAGHMEWVCLEDRDRDGAFDNAWRPVTRSLGLSYSRLDMPIAPQVGTLAAPPADAGGEANVPAALRPRLFERVIAVARINAGRIVIEARLVQDGNSERLERREVPLSGPAEIILAGIVVSVTPTGRGAANVSARGAFTAAGVRLTCDDSRLDIGEFSLTTNFGFPNW